MRKAFRSSRATGAPENEFSLDESDSNSHKFWAYKPTSDDGASNSGAWSDFESSRDSNDERNDEQEIIKSDDEDLRRGLLLESREFNEEGMVIAQQVEANSTVHFVSVSELDGIDNSSNSYFTQSIATASSEDLPLWPRLPLTSLTPFTHNAKSHDLTPNISNLEYSRRRQGRLLLVSLLENFCMIYGQSPERNRKLFFLICKTLSAMGIIEEEHIEEMASVRGRYQTAFKNLLMSALESIRREHMAVEDGRRLAMNSSEEDAYRKPMIQRPSLSSFSAAPTAFLQNQHPISFEHILSLENSRYNDDFRELHLIGNGGFASVWKTRNKLDGKEYAIKKIRLGNSRRGYERVFREIKCLARLEHLNVVRYYSSWLEHIFHQGGEGDESMYTSRVAELQTSNSIDSRSEVNSMKDRKEKKNKSVSQRKWSQRTQKNIDKQFSEYSYEIHFSDISADEDGNSDEESVVIFADQSQDGQKYLRNESESEEELAMNGVKIPIKTRHSRRSYSASPNSPSRSSAKHSFQPRGFTTTSSSFKSSSLKSSKSFSSSPFSSSHQSTPPNSNVSFPPKLDLTLFIQMQLCHATLYDLLQVRNSEYARHTDQLRVVDAAINIQLFRGIVAGVDYIHSQGLIHRDLKPSNIFLEMPTSGRESIGTIMGNAGDTEWNEQKGLMLMLNLENLIPKIGDFGLVTNLEQTMNEKERENWIVDNDNNDYLRSPNLSTTTSGVVRTSDVGTIAYASPEQLSQPPQSYNEKADIFSLGIIFFELYHPFATSMERVQVLRDLRDGVLPEDFVQHWPKEAAMILWMTAQDPVQRPSACEILEFELLVGTTQQAAQSLLEAQLLAKSHELELKLIENETLKKRVEELEMALQRCSCLTRREINEEDKSKLYG